VCIAGYVWWAIASCVHMHGLTSVLMRVLLRHYPQHAPSMQDP